MVAEKQNILYVDDEENNLNSFMLNFRRKYNIFTALSGAKGIQILESHPIHLIVTDQKMPKMTGVEFLKKVKEKWPAPKCILLTGYTDHEVIKEAINDVGIYWYLNKPYDPNEMESLMNKAIDAYQEEEEKNTINEKLAGLMQSAKDGIITFNQEGIISMLNPSIKKMFGYSEEELLGQHMEMLIPDTNGNPSKLIQDLEAKAKSNDSTAPEQIFHGRIKKGKLIPLEISVSRMIMGEQVAYNAILRDISQRVDAEKLIVASEAYYRTIFQNALYGIAITGVNFEFVKVNEAFCKLIGYSEKELLIKMNVKDVTTPEVYSESDEILRKMVIGEIKEGSLEKNYRTKSGRVVEAITFVRGIYDEQGKYIGNAATILDITERKRAELAVRESEEKFRSLFDSANDGIYIIDPVTNEFLDVNDSASKSLGYSSEELIGKQVTMLFPKEQHSLIKKKIEELRKSKKISFEIEHVRKDGSTVEVEISSAIFNIEGREVFQSFVREISERKKAERRIQKMNDELENKVLERTAELEGANDELKKAEEEILEAYSKEKELGELKSRFVATASHQFRTPLTVIQSNVELLEMNLDKLQEDLKPRFHKSFERISKETNRMTDLMNDVLILGKINARAMLPSRKRIDVSVVGRDLVERLNEVEGVKSKIHLQVINKPRKIFIDSNHLEHILLNVLGNAQKYSQERGDISFEIIFNNEAVELIVADKGIGMSEEDLKNLFQPFFRGKNTAGIQGTGLGMSIIYEYIKINFGEIDVVSKLDKGTTVKISFKYDEPSEG